MILLNKSSSPIAITRIGLVDNKGKEHFFVIHEVAIALVRNKLEDAVMAQSSLDSTQFPVHLVEHGASLLHVYIPIDNSEFLETLGFPLLRLSPLDDSLEDDESHTTEAPMPHIFLPNDNEDETEACNWDCHFRLHTSKKRRHLDVVARYVPFAAFEKPALDAINLSKNQK